MNKEDWTKEDWNHHMARLVMMAAEERGEMISYEDALKQAVSQLPVSVAIQADQFEFQFYVEILLIFFEIMYILQK